MGIKGNHSTKNQDLWYSSWDLICLMKVSDCRLMSCSSTVGKMETEIILWAWDVLCILAPPTQEIGTLEWAQLRDTEMVNAGAHPCRGAEGAGLVQSGEGKALRGDNGSPHQCPWGGCQGHREPDSPLLCLVGWWETLGMSWRRRGSDLWNFPPEGSQALEQMTQRLCDSILGVGELTPTGLAQSLQQFGLTPEQSGLTLLLWAGDWHRGILNSIPTWVFLWSNDLLYFSQTVHIRKQIIVLPNLFKLNFIYCVQQIPSSDCWNLLISVSFIMVIFMIWHHFHKNQSEVILYQSRQSYTVISNGNHRSWWTGQFSDSCEWEMKI